MIQIIITGHAHFASGLKSSVELIMGEQSDLYTIDFPSTDTQKELDEHMDSLLNSFDKNDNILIFADILSGSPFNTSIMRAMKDDRIRVYYGTNLAVVLETIMDRLAGKNFEEILDDIIEKGRSQIGIFNKNIENDDFDD